MSLNAFTPVILLVDDHVDLADALGEILSEAGHSVDIAYNGEQAMTKARSRMPSIAFLDYRIGSRITGLELLADLRTINPEIVCVVMTADSEQEVAIGALKAGVFDYIRKPADPLNVINVANSALESVRRKADSQEETQRLVEKATAADSTRTFMKSLGAEIREPLSLILGYAELLSPGNLTDGAIATQSDAIASIKESAAMLLKAVGTAAELSARAEDDEFEDPAPTDIVMLLKSVRDRTAACTKFHGTVIDIATDGALPQALADRQSLRKLLCQLVEAALALTLTDVRLTACHEAQQGLIVVKLECRLRSAPGTAPKFPDVLPNGLNLAQTLAWRAGIGFTLSFNRSSGLTATMTIPIAASAVKAVA